MTETRKYTVSYRSPDYSHRRSASFKDKSTAIGYALEKERDGRTHIKVKETIFTEDHRYLERRLGAIEGWQ